MGLHRFAVLVLAISLLLGAVIFTAVLRTAVAEGAVAGIETSPFDPPAQARGRLAQRPALPSLSDQCACVLPHRQVIGLAPATPQTLAWRL